MSQLTNPKISVVIPVKNASKTIARCLDALYINNAVDFEVIVVDDGCTDNTIEIVSKYKCRAVKNDLHKGVSGARNIGASVSRGDVVVFIDSDIVIPENTLSKILFNIQAANDSAIVGRLSKHIKFNNFSSQYKNLWMYYTFSKLSDDICLLFTSISAIKRDVFLEHGGFDVNYTYPNVEDNELGMRMQEKGHKITLDKTLQVEHLKYYTVLTLLETHYFRAKGLIKLYYRNRFIKQLKRKTSSVPRLFILNIPLSILFLWLLIMVFFGGFFFLKIVLLSFLLLLSIIVNYDWLYFLNKKRGIFFAIKSMCYLVIESLVTASGLMVGQIEYVMGKKY